MIIKILMTLLFKAVIRWYKKHPKGALATNGTRLSYYGSMTIGIDTEDQTAIARLTLQTDEQCYYDIKAPIHGKKVRI